MLTDRRIEQERRAREMRRRRKLPWALGSFIAGLAPWDWFVTLTLRDREPHGEEAWERGELTREANVTIYKPDPRLVRYKPSSRYSRQEGPQAPGAALALIEGLFLDVQKLAGRPIGWVIAEGFGRLGGRWHCHILVVGTSQVLLVGSATTVWLYTNIAVRPKTWGGLLHVQICRKICWRNPFWWDVGRNRFVEV